MMMMHSGSIHGYKCPKLFISCNGCNHDSSASWEAHINSNASDLVSLSPSCFDVPRQECFRNTDMYVVIVVLLSWRITEMARFRMTRSDTCS